jgi:chromosome segregation ATPase
MSDSLQDMLELEQQQVTLAREIDKVLDDARRTGRRLIDAKGELEKIDRNLTDLRAQVHRMKHDFKVVLLSEYEQTLRLIGNNEAMRTTRLDEIVKLNVQGKKANDTLPVLRAKLAQVERQLGDYGQVLEFRR